MTDITISLGPNGGFRCFIPSMTKEGGHHVNIPLSTDGLKALRKLLIQREQAIKATIGQDASPTQQMIEQWLRQMQIDREASASAKIKEIVPEVDLSDITI